MSNEPYEKFTHGPWAFMFDFDGSNPRVETDDMRDEVICRFDELSQVVHDNGHLIAAAPVMYGALKDVCGCCDRLANWEDLFNIGVEGISVQYPACPCEDCFVDKALKKARGELND